MIVRENFVVKSIHLNDLWRNVPSVDILSSAVAPAGDAITAALPKDAHSLLYRCRPKYQGRRFISTIDFCIKLCIICILGLDSYIS